MLPTAAIATVIGLSARAFATATSSFSDFAGTDGCTTNRFVVSAIMVIGARSRATS